MINSIKNWFSPKKVSISVYVVDKMPSEKCLKTTDDLYLEKEFFIKIACAANESGRTFSEFIVDALKWSIKHPEQLETHLAKKKK